MKLLCALLALVLAVAAYSPFLDITYYEHEYDSLTLWVGPYFDSLPDDGYLRVETSGDSAHLPATYSIESSAATDYLKVEVDMPRLFSKPLCEDDRLTVEYDSVYVVLLDKFDTPLSDRILFIDQYCENHPIGGGLPGWVIPLFILVLCFPLICIGLCCCGAIGVASCCGKAAVANKKRREVAPMPVNAPGAQMTGLAPVTSAPMPVQPVPQVGYVSQPAPSGFAPAPAFAAPMQPPQAQQPYGDVYAQQGVQPVVQPSLAPQPYAQPGIQNFGSDGMI